MDTQGCSATTHHSSILSLKTKKYLLSGILIMVPFAITLAAIAWLFTLIKKLLLPLVDILFKTLSALPNIGRIDPFYLKIVVSLLAIVLLFFLLYLVGAIGARVMGRRLLSLVEGIIKRIPIAGAMYNASKQVVETFGANNRPAYKSVVLVEFPKPGCKSIGFFTGSVTLPDGKKHGKVFIPTAPNPTSGYFVMIPASEIQELDLPVEETFKMILSVGLVSPEQLEVKATNPT